MHEIDNEKFGVFLSQLRKEKGYTQKDLAQKLFISDKAVSKWERGASMPDVALLIPLSEILGVSTTELLRGEFINQPETMSVEEVEKLVTGAINLSTKEDLNTQNQNRKKNTWLFILCSFIVMVEILLLRIIGYSIDEMAENIFIIEGLCFIFGAWLCIFVKETLPKYYDENKISTYSDGIFRMNMAGLCFNNSNWKHIIRVQRIWILSAYVLFPMVYLVGDLLLRPIWQDTKLFITLFAGLGFFIPMYIVGKRYE